MHRVEAEAVELPGRHARLRLEAAGAPALDDVELLALLLDGGDGRVASALRAARLLDAAGGLTRLANGDAAFALALGPRWRRAAVRVRAALELGRRAAARRLPLGAPLCDPVAVYEHVRGHLPQLDRERFVALLLDGRNRFLLETRISEGTLTAALVHPREVFAPAVRAAAAAVILVHNHPSGDPTPSAEDEALTARLRQAGELMGIRILDHVIVAQGRWCSMADGGRW